MGALAHLARGQALADAGEPAAAETELLSAAALAEQIGRVRLCWDIHMSLASLYHTRGRDDEADRHASAARDIAHRIMSNLRDPALRSAVAALHNKPFS
jgi:Flp pilus assembly protein TadD